MPKRVTQHQRQLADTLHTYLRSLARASDGPIRTPTNAEIGRVLGAHEQTIARVIDLLVSARLIAVEYLPVKEGQRTRHRRRVTLLASESHPRMEFTWSHLGGRLIADDPYDMPPVDPVLQARFNRPRPGFYRNFIQPAMTTLCDIETPEKRS